MKKLSAIIEIHGLLGHCANLEVFLGFASAKVLHSISFADVLNEDTGKGYQRPYNKRHSLDFKQYISREGSSTIPLTFNLRPDLPKAWELRDLENNQAILRISTGIRCLAQVDCQHRLGELHDSEIPLAFMTFIGLDLRTEMGLFVIINSKAKGLSSSLTDFHQSNLLDNLAEEAPHLFIARRLNEDPYSPWFQLIRYGGETTSGLKRRTSLRMMQKTLSSFLSQTRALNTRNLDEKYDLVVSYWRAVAKVFPNEWGDYRHHLLAKGVGLYSLMFLMTDIVRNNFDKVLNEDYFVNCLMPLKDKVDWRTNGSFADAGGQKGAVEVYQKLKSWIKI